MFNRFAKSRATIGALLVASALFSASLVAPAIGATSPLTLVKRALKTAKKANKTANSANRTATKATKTADSANRTAKSASDTAKSASSSATSARSVANSALATAVGPGKDAGPGGFDVSQSVPVPDDGSAVHADATCPDGFTAAGGGVDVFDGDTLDLVNEGIAITEDSTTINGWGGSVQDQPGASSVADREMEVSVECAKITDLVTNPAARAAEHRLRTR
jgi:hypothetical protein